MKKFMKNRVLPIVCALSILISLCVVPVASAFDPVYVDNDSVNQWTYRFQNPTGEVNAFLLDAFSALNGLPTDTDPVEVTWSFFNTAVSTYGEVELGVLNQLVSTYNGYFNLPPSESGYSFGEYAENLGRNVVAGLLGLPDMHFEVQTHPSTGLLRIKETTYDIWVVNSSGMYPYVIPNPNEDSDTSDKWIGEVTAADRATKEVAIHSLDRLNMMCLQLKDAGIPAQIKTLGTNYKCIWYNRQVYANAEGVPYVAWVDDNKSAINQDRQDTIVMEDGTIVEGDLTDNSTNIDLENMLITLPNGAINIIDKIIYDESTKSYHIDSHDTYNYTVNNYYTWNYYINYTSITYIGQTEEYNKYYEVYYELPDGRDSADLTKEELEQLNLSIDVIPYGRSADDTSLRSLYHFDGDTRDSSYWNYCTDFTWVEGASLTYMDAGVFEGALYLDETDHTFEVLLPSTISMQDFTIQFRYYQSATAAPSRDSYLKIDGNGSSLIQFDGRYIYDIDANQLAVLPVGSWNEIAIMRESGTVYIYLNGVRIGSYSYAAALPAKMHFHFGSTQQTYKYIDELRVLNYALQSGGANYECTSVPHDTNLALVLPDTATPVADEYWVWDETITPEWSKDFTTGYSDGFAYSGLTSLSQVFSEFKDRLLYVGSITNIEESHGFASVTTYGSTMMTRGQNGHGLVFPISGSDTRTDPEYRDYSGFNSRWETQGNAGPHTFSLVTRDGEVCSLSFDLFYPFSMDSIVKASATFDWGSIHYVDCSDGNPRFTYIWVLPNPGVTLDFVYMEIVEGSTPNVNHEFVESVTGIDKDDLNTPTLAVRTDIDITSYQIGGVRPSVPKKGLVWALVENQRITSIQIYNGQAWESCDGRIWTGSRWIPASSYNIVTLQDMYDIVDSTPDYEYIYTESGFWSWWQKSWNAFTEKLFSLLGTGGTGGGSGATGGSGSNGLKDVDLDEDITAVDPEEEDGKSLWQFIVLVIDGGKSVIKGTRHLFSGVVSSVPDAMDNITGAFDVGGVAVGAFDGSGTDPDAAELPEAVANTESEVLDPWRYH